MKPLLSDDKADIGAVGTAVAILVAIIIAVLVVYNIAGSLDVSDIDDEIAINIQDTIGEGDGTAGDDLTNYSGNSTRDILDQSATFFTIAPLIVVVLVAVIILGYVIQLGGRRR